MKLIFWICTSVLMTAISCSTSDENLIHDEIELIDTEIIEHADELKNEIVDFGNHKYEVFPATDTVKFQGIEGYNWQEEAPFLKEDERVFRKADSIFFVLETTDTISVFDIKYSEVGYGNSVNYLFQGTVENSEYWELHAIGYECHWFVLINKLNGFSMVLNGRSTLSPNGKFLMAINPDIDSGYTINCLELTEVLDDSLVKIGTFQPRDWGPKNIKWINDNELLMTKMFVCQDSEFYENCYENVVLKKID